MSRVLGPYPSGRGYRLVVVVQSASGERRRKSLIYATQAEALARRPSSARVSCSCSSWAMRCRTTCRPCPRAACGRDLPPGRRQLAVFCPSANR